MNRRRRRYRCWFRGRCSCRDVSQLGYPRYVDSLINLELPGVLYIVDPGKRGFINIISHGNAIKSLARLDCMVNARRSACRYQQQKAEDHKQAIDCNISQHRISKRGLMFKSRMIFAHVTRHIIAYNNTLHQKTYFRTMKPPIKSTIKTILSRLK